MGDSTPQWFLADLPDGAATPWDLAHGRVADQLGVAGSDVIFAEPDILHNVYQDTNEDRTAEGFGATTIECVQNPQDNSRGKPVGPNAIWHLGDEFSQLRRARESVRFTDPRLPQKENEGHRLEEPHAHDQRRQTDDGEARAETAEGRPDGLVDTVRRQGRRREDRQEAEWQRQRQDRHQALYQ